MDKVANHLAKTSPLVRSLLVTVSSPLGWDHIILSGDFDWHSGAAERTIARSLHLRSVRAWKNVRMFPLLYFLSVVSSNKPSDAAKICQLRGRCGFLTLADLKKTEINCPATRTSLKEIVVGHL